MTLHARPLLALFLTVPIAVAACGSSGGTSATTLSGSSSSAGLGGSSSVGTGTGTGGTLFATSSTSASSSAGGGSSTGSGTASTGSGSVVDAGLGDFCSGSGAIPIPGSTDCTGDLGKKTFLFAACSCGDFSANNTVDTDSFNSANPSVPLAGGSVGVDGNYSAVAATTIKGALIVGGSLSTSNQHDVVQDLQCGGTATISHTSVAESDAYIGGDVISSNLELTVDGKLYTPVAANAAKVTAVGGTTVGPVSVPPPCECSKPIDIAGVVAAFQGTNDNATNGIMADALTANPSMPSSLTLPCGRYFLSGIQSNSSVSIELKGRTVLAVAGDLSVAGAFTITLDAGAELDLFITGNVGLNNQASIGSVASPASTRIYVGGSQVALAGQLSLAANLYMPNAQLTANNDLEMWGAVFAKSIVTANHFKVHYDEAILTIDGCQPSGTPCADCHDCVNPKPACGANGECGACTADKDCCPPLVCNGMGDCVPPPPK